MAESKLIKAARELIKAYEAAELEDDRDIHKNPEAQKKLKALRGAICKTGLGYIKTGEAAQLLGISKSTLLKEMKKRRPRWPYHKPYGPDGYPAYKIDELQKAAEATRRDVGALY